MKKIIFFIFIFSLFCFANNFELRLLSKVQTNLEIHNNTLYFGCENGDVYSLNIIDQEINWKINIGKKPGSSLSVLDNNLIIYSENSVYLLNQNKGAIENQYSFTEDIAGITVDTGQIYITTRSGVYALSKNAEVKWDLLTFGLYSTKTKPVMDEYYIYFGIKDEMYALDKNQGEIIWKAKTSTPIYIKEGNLRVFVSTEDNKIKTFEITEGREVWNYKAGGWITDIEEDNGTVFFISNDYYIYSVNADNGTLLWKKLIGDMTDLEVKENILLVGTKDNKIYGLNRETGEEGFIIHTSDWPMNLLIKNNFVIYSTLDKKVAYAYIDHVCTFNYPSRRSVVSSAEFKLNGTTYSIDNSITKVQIGIKKEDIGDYTNAQGINTWTAYVDPYEFTDGILDIGCVLSPYSDRDPTIMQVIKTPQSTLIEDMKVTFPEQTELQQNIQIYALNKYNRTIKGLTALYDNKEYVADSNGYISLFFSEPGLKLIEISRKGYKTQQIQIQAGDTPGTDDYTLYYLAGIIILIIIIVFLIKKIKQ
ncbi:PQQ-like beta-propeller repeat protein [Candidatus Micrarchaeota archaeon]|jgi:hypothetical protein|nr:PQQ-like beta-propeller repeat protein [Candidatus Micrarchaeota archaeon]